MEEVDQDVIVLGGGWAGCARGLPSRSVISDSRDGGPLLVRWRAGEGGRSMPGLFKEKGFVNPPDVRRLQTGAQAASLPHIIGLRDLPFA